MVRECRFLVSFAFQFEHSLIVVLRQHALAACALLRSSTPSSLFYCVVPLRLVFAQFKHSIDVVVLGVLFSLELALIPLDNSFVVLLLPCAVAACLSIARALHCR